jgi:hypothetical protein
MPRRRKPSRAAPDPSHQFKIRLPQDVAQRIAEDAAAERRPMNRIIIDDLAAIPQLKESARRAEQARDMDVVFAKYASRITWQDLSERLLDAVDTVLAAQGGAQQAAIDKLRVVRTGMLEHERTHAKRK